jgi:hypothetical protein
MRDGGGAAAGLSSLIMLSAAAEVFAGRPLSTLALQAL